MKKITDIVWELAEPAVQEQGCRIWDVEYAVSYTHLTLPTTVPV